MKKASRPIWVTWERQWEIPGKCWGCWPCLVARCSWALFSFALTLHSLNLDYAGEPECSFLAALWVGQGRVSMLPSFNGQCGTTEDHLRRVFQLMTLSGVSMRPAAIKVTPWATMAGGPRKWVIWPWGTSFLKELKLLYLCGWGKCCLLSLLTSLGVRHKTGEGDKRPSEWQNLLSPVTRRAHL